jgi:DNA-binding transcriptional LysR family regulator
MSMDLRQLEYLVAVADHGGFTRAAATQHVSQPSLSHGIRTLEAELGVELFFRLGRTVQATPAGQLVIDAARRVLRDMADLGAVAAAAAGADVGHLDLVVLPTLAVDPMAGLVGRFRTAHPQVTVRVAEPEEAEQLERVVASGRAEVGLTDITTGGRGLTRLPLFRQELFAVGPPDAPDGRTPISAAQLAATPLVATPPGTSTRRLLDLVLARSGAVAHIAVEISNREAILPLVLAGAGTSLLPAPLAERAAEQGATVRPFSTPVTRRIGLVHRPGSLSPAATAFVALARAARS